jgi:hypothetical protein
MTPRQFAVAVRCCTCLGLLPLTPPLLAAEGPVTPPAAPAGVATPGPAEAQAPAPGARRGGRGRGGPLTAEDQAAIAALGNLPAWKPGIGDGDYTCAPPYVPAPENTPRDDVPQGRVATFQMDLAGSQFYP